MINKPLISVIINVRNEAENLKKCLSSLKKLPCEIIIVDMHSTDNSVEVAKSFNAKIFPYRYCKVVEPARNFGISKSSGKWVLILDPDEYINKTLRKELLKITKRSDIDYVKIPRKNIIFGKWLRHCNCWPDYLIRFFKKGSISWKKEIHSQPQTKGNGLSLLDSEKLAIRHQNYVTITQYLQRTIRYSDVQAGELEESQYKLKISDFLLRPTQEFNSRFFFAEGYKDGLHGLIFCLLQSFSVLLIYIRLWEKQDKQDKIIPKESFVSASQEATFEYSYWFTRYFREQQIGNIFQYSLIKIRHLLNRLTKNV